MEIKIGAQIHFEVNSHSFPENVMLGNKRWVSVESLVEHFKDFERDPEGCIILLLEEINPTEKQLDGGKK